MVLLNGTSLTTSALARAARNASINVKIAPDAMSRVAATRAWLDRQLAQTPLPSIYGITTGFGEFKRVTIPRDRLIELQQNILLSHAAGIGDNSNSSDPSNYFPPDVVRAALIIRLNTFLRGHSAVTVHLATYLAAIINAGVVPLVPTRGSLGSSGDLCPLCHTFLPLLGEGHFYIDEGTQASDGEPKQLGRPIALYPGRELHRVMMERLRALGRSNDASDAERAREQQLGAWRARRRSDADAERGVQPVFPVLEKEGLALSNGATYSAAMLALACEDARVLADSADAAAALTLQGIRGRTHALLDEVHAARGLVGQRQSAARIRTLLQGSTLADTHDDVQDCYSVRCSPQVHGASRDALTFASTTAEAEINAACDNPLFFQNQNTTGYRVVSAGNFHGQPIALAADFLAIALAELANISERRTQMLLDQNHNRGLPSNLTACGGLESGLMLAQYAAASLVSENKVLCHPASVDSIPSSSNVEDHVAMATHGARKLRIVLGNATKVLAIELMTAAAAAEWRVFIAGRSDARHEENAGTDVTHGDARAKAFAAFASASRSVVEASLGASAKTYTAVRGAVAPLVHDRVLSGDILAIASVIESGLLSGLTEVDG